MQGEISIRQALAELDKWGASDKFDLTEFTAVDGRRVVLVKEWSEMIGRVGDHRSLLQSLHGSPYFPAFEGQAADWENKLSTLDAIMSVLQTVQRKWVYLEPIFGRGALPKEQVDAPYADRNLNTPRSTPFSQARAEQVFATPVHGLQWTRWSRLETA